MTETRTFTVRIVMGNDAMKNHHNLASVLHHLASQIDQGKLEGGIRDVNGNTVGRFSHGMEPDDEPAPMECPSCGYAGAMDARLI